MITVPRFSVMPDFLWFLILPAALLVAIIDCLSRSPRQRARRLHRSGLSQRAVAERMGVSRYRVRQLLTA